VETRTRLEFGQNTHWQQCWRAMQRNTVKAPRTEFIRSLPIMNRAACGCKLWDFEIGYHSQN
ncbi:hypothetical protein, partial [Pseudomonas amygdali]|uniref:hypothetical protein n=1 Tax=Pseudomonas amygdali TaxID=47877 RepID=UPI001CA551D7